MKKILLLISSIFLVIMLTGCAKKTSITTKEFVSYAHEHTYEPYNIIEQYSQFTNIKEATLVRGREGWQIEFYVLIDANAADNMFITNKNKFEKSKGTSSSSMNTSGTNYKTYTLKTNGEYKYISRIDNTLLFVDENANYEKEIKEFINEIGY